MREAWAGLTPGRRRFVLAGIVMGVVATIIIVWFALAATVPKPQWKDISFTVPNDTEVQMRYMVTKPPEMTAECLLLAQETNHGVVGRMTVVLGPSTERTTVHEATIRTTSLAVIGTVRSCHEQ
nr:DUF4307 domain-containing protein [Kineosphaera limosa]